MADEEKRDAPKKEVLAELMERRKYDQVLKEFQLDVEAAYSDCQSAEQEVNKLNKELKTAKKTYDKALAKYIKMSSGLMKMAKSDLKNYQQTLWDFQTEVDCSDLEQDGDDDDDKEYDESEEDKPAKTNDEPKPSDNWKKVPARDFFEFTEKEWEKLENLAGADEPLSTGKLADFVDSMRRGMKVEGFGPAKIEKIESQFMKFWESDIYKNTTEKQIEAIENTRASVEEREGCFE